jgi:hypothetical protein
VPAAENDPHDHRGFLVSRIIGGRVRNDEFQTSTGPESTPFMHYRDHLADSLHRLTEVGMTTLAADRSVVHSENDTYSLARDTVHRTCPVTPFPAITLVLEGPHTREFSNVYRISPRPAYRVVPVSCTLEFFRETIEVVLTCGRHDS